MKVIAAAALGGFVLGQAVCLALHGEYVYGVILVVLAGVPCFLQADRGACW